MSCWPACLRCAPSPEPEVAELDLAHCSLDHVPIDLFVYERTLERLCLDYNNIQDLPRQLFHCQELKELSVSDNDLHQLPSALASLVHLTKLNVAKNVLTDIPDTIKQLKCLQVLDVSVNPLQKIPEGCTQLLNVTELYLNDTFLEFLPANFGRLVKLRILELRENGLHALPKSLARLTELERLDIGQNDFGELPDVLGSLVNIQELWLDANHIQVIPAFIGRLSKLNHLEASFNHLEQISEEIGLCSDLEHLSLTTNDLKFLPHQIGGCQRLITLKVDDNQLESVPQSIGQLKRLEELILSQNDLETIPSSIGLCRRLHTLNVDDNDVEFLPKELGSCAALKILSAHGNRLTTLPAELDHITGLSVINLTANMIQHLPVSFMRLRQITALWLSENQTQPLVQLNQDTDPETGQRVLTNFLLPQVPESEGHLDAVSESGSFHASVWEEERPKKTLVKWAGEEGLGPTHDNPGLDDSREDKSGGHLRREPTPFPKEMRAMAKRAQALRSKEPRPNGHGSHHLPSHEAPTQASQTKSASGWTATAVDSTSPASESHHGSVHIREAKVSRPQAAQANLALANGVGLEPHPGDVSFELTQPNAGSSSRIPSRAVAKRTPGPLSERGSRDSGVATPSESSPDPTDPNHRHPSDPLPRRPELAQAGGMPNGSNRLIPPPYHIAAAFSKRAGDFQPGGNVPNHSASDTNSVSESEVSTTASSLQTIVRAPTQGPSGGSRLNRSFQASPLSRVPDGGEKDAHALELRKVSEQLMANPRTRQSVTGSALIHSSSSRPGSFASPSGSTPISMVPYARSNSQMGPGPKSNGGLPGEGRPSSRGPTPSGLARAFNGSGEPPTGGLLTTIEQVAMSDDDEDDGDMASFEQPNYENVSSSGAAYHIASATRTELALMNGHTAPTDRLSTSQFVMNGNIHHTQLVHGRMRASPQPALLH